MENMKKTAHIHYEWNQILITSPYDTNFVSELKSGTKSRRWNPEKKGWTLDLRERKELLAIVNKFYQVVEDNQPEKIKTNSAEPIDANLDLNSTFKSGMEFEIWTDGACAGNPGPGGYGIIFKCNGSSWEKAGGFKLTTNNRMEIMAAIVALETLSSKSKVMVYTDSKYLVDSIMKGWAKKWKSKGWQQKGRKRLNYDLWDRLLGLCERHQIKFEWVKGHTANVENERCDQLAESAARKPNLPADEGYVVGESRRRRFKSV